jgi:hypothetical protein
MACTLTAKELEGRKEGQHRGASGGAPVGAAVSPTQVPQAKAGSQVPAETRSQAVPPRIVTTVLMPPHHVRQLRQPCPSRCWDGYRKHRVMSATSWQLRQSGHCLAAGRASSAGNSCLSVARDALRSTNWGNSAPATCKLDRETGRVRGKRAQWACALSYKWSAKPTATQHARPNKGSGARENMPSLASPPPPAQVATHARTHPHAAT